MAIISYGIARASLWNEIGRRLSDFARCKWGPLGKKRLLFRLLMYFFGAILAMHSIIEIFYDFNFRLFDLHTLPTWDFYRQQVTPFLAQPLTWIGLNLRSLHSYVALSAVGAAIWAHAEYKTGQYLFLYPFPKIQPRPGHIDMGSWSEPPEFPSPPRIISKRNLLRLLEKFVLTYLFLGAIAAVVALFAGLRTLRRWGRELAVLILVTIGLPLNTSQRCSTIKSIKIFGTPSYETK
jgi:hypothetical protein